MTNSEIDRCLESMVLLVDTREQPTERMKRRLETTGLPYVRQKIDAGDYSCRCTMPCGKELDFSSRVAIERKMNLDELCLCFGRERARYGMQLDFCKEETTGKLIREILYRELKEYLQGGAR